MKDEPCIGHVNVAVLRSIAITEIRLKVIHKLYIENILIHVITQMLLSPVIKNPISISGIRIDKSNDCLL